MSTPPKFSTLIQAWVDYIWLSDLTSAEVDSGNESRTCIWDKGVNLVKDELFIDSALFEQLKSELLTLKSKGKTSSFQIAIAFPQIYVIKGSSRKFRPLFTQDISSIFQDNYRTSGWNLTEFEFHPVLPNLVDLYQIEEEEAESLVTREGLKVFLETTFHLDIKVLQDFVDEIHLPRHPARSRRVPYLLRFDFVAFNYNLKKDLQKISSQTNSDWAVPGQPAYEYLYGQPVQPRREVIMLGAFPVHPPTESQALALKHATENPVTAVVGPPGNGKTTLLLHKIAQQVVKRAVNLATTGQDKSNLTIVTSTNNRAVNNVNERLSTSFPTDQFYLSGGAKALNIKQVLPRLQAAVDSLQGATFDSARWSQTQSQLLALESKFQHYLELDQLNQQQRPLDLELLEQLNTDIQSRMETIEASRLEPAPSDQPDYLQFPFDAYVEIKKHLEEALRSLPRQGKANNFVMQLVYQLKRLWHSLTQTTEQHILKRLHQKISSPVLATLATPFPFQIPLNRSALLRTILSVEQQLQTAYLFQSGTSNATSLTKLEEYSQQMQSLLVDREQVEKRLRAYPQFDFYTRQSTEYHEQQVELFQVSNSFLQMEALRRKSSTLR